MNIEKIEEIEKLLEDNFLHRSDTKIETKDLVGCEVLYVKHLGISFGVMPLVMECRQVYETDIGNFIKEKGKVILELNQGNNLIIFIDRAFKDQFVISQKEIIDLFENIFNCPEEDYKDIAECLIPLVRGYSNDYVASDAISNFNGINISDFSTLRYQGTTSTGTTYFPKSNISVNYVTI